MTREEIKATLSANGIQFVERTIDKNGVKFEGLIIGEGNIRPTLYYNNLEGFESTSSLMEYINSVSTTPSFNIQELMNKEYILNNCIIALQKVSTDDTLIKRNFLDLEQIIRVVIPREGNEVPSYKLTTTMMKLAELDEAEVFERAMINSKSSHCTNGLIDTLLAMGMNEDMLPPLDESEPQMIVASNNLRINGASALCDLDLMKATADRYHTDQLYIIPSSIHEVIYLTNPTNEDLRESYNEMINSVNNTELKPEEVLADHCYIYDRNTNTISY